jgi:hypothetical protein
MKLSILKKYNTQVDLAGIAGYLYMSFLYLSLWISPQVSDVKEIQIYSLLMELEFFAIFSGLFLFMRPKKLWGLLIGILPMLLFAWGLSKSSQVYEVFYIYLFTLFNRLRFAFSNTNEEFGLIVFKRNFLAMPIYLSLIGGMGFVSVFGLIPQLGLTDNFLENSGYNSIEGSTGWLDKPQENLCFGVLYYLMLAVLDYKQFFSKSPWLKSI